MVARFNPPPNWPAPPAGWTPPPGWSPDPSWGPAPEGWQLWLDEPNQALVDANTPSAEPDSYRAALPGQPAAARGPRPWFRKKRVIIPGAFLLLIVFISALNGGSDAGDRTPVAAGVATLEADPVDEKSAEEIAAEDARAEAAAAAAAEAERLAEEQRLAEEAAAAAAAAADVARLGTLSQQNAYSQASNYVETMPFSRAGLLAQLTSEYGGQFPPEDAEFGVARLEAEGAVDWFAEAVEAANSYQEMIPMSRQGLIDQLTSQYGSQFTLDQATHAVDTLGL